MPHVVTQSCCNDASCTYACPVNCIQPTPGDPDFAAAEMLHVDPLTCVDCGACVSACPVSAIKPHTALTEVELPFLAINRRFHERRRQTGEERSLLARPPARLRVPRQLAPPRVAVVGSGPSGLYAADEVLTIPGAQVTIFERLDRPYGLARYGVAPDHRRTRRISGQFEQIRRARGLRFELGTEVGVDVTHAELLRRFDAVIYAVGTPTDRRLEIPGVDRAGVHTATEFVGFYNGHPDHADTRFDLDTRRAVVIGNGNVGLDVARILAVDPDALAGTDIAPAALALLRRSRVEEVLVTSRRGPGEAAFTLPELLGLAGAPGIALDPGADPDAIAGTKLEWLAELPETARAGRRRVGLRFGWTPEAITASGVRFATPEGPVEIEAGLVLTSIGYAGVPVAGLPFDPVTRTVPHERGRVLDPVTGAPIPGTYVTGWIKRGPNGFLGTNRADSQETVRALVEDLSAGRHTNPTPELAQT